MPWIASSPLIRLTCWIRSLINRPRSRLSRRSSSSATLGTHTTLHTFGSPRRYAIRDRINRSTSTWSVFATCPTIDLQTCRVDHVVADAVCFEQAMEPEAVIASFVARNDLHTPL